MINYSQLARWGIFLLWLLLTLSIFFRTPIPIDETRYLSVAWEMWLRQDFLVPYLNGEPYSHKPPLLFWLIQLSWSLFGAREWAARIIGPLFALLSLLLIRALARRLWPEEPDVALLAPWVLIATVLWTLFATATMFDILLGSCVLFGILGLVNATQGKNLQGWGNFALAIGLGALAKGPVILVHLMPVAILMPFWIPQNLVKNYYRWYGFLFLALLCGVLIGLAWALSAAFHGGEAYGKAILWSQTADRAVTSNLHAHPFWWYLLLLPLFIFPWVAWPRVWQCLGSLPWKNDSSIRLCAVWFTSSFVVFSLIQSKQVHYLLPLFPAFSLLVTRLLVKDERPRKLIAELVVPFFLSVVGLFLMFLASIAFLDKLAWAQAMDSIWGGSVLIIGILLFALTLYLRQLSILAVSTSIVLAIFIGFICFFKNNALAYNLKPAAEKVKYFQTHNIPIAYVGNYQGQFHFLGRLTQPIEVVHENQVLNWAIAHPEGYLISKESQSDDNVSYIQRQRERWLIFRTGQQVQGREATKQSGK